MDAVVTAPGRARAGRTVDAPRARSVGTAAALAGIVALAAVLRGWGLAHQGLWYDEAITAWLVGATPGQMLGAIPVTESTPPLYYALAAGWVRIFGDTEAGLRSLSALAGVSAVPVAFAAARELSTRRAGLLAALLVAVNPLLVWYSQEARAYSLLVLAAGASFWLYLRARTDPTPRRLVAWAAVSVAALCTHYFAAFVVAPEALALLARRRPALRWRLAAAAALAGAAAGLAVLAWAQRAHAHWQGAFSLALRAKQVPAQLLVGFAPPATHVALALVAAAAAACVALPVLRGSAGERRRAAVAGAVALAAVAIPLVLALLGVDYLNTRNVMGAAVPLAVALGICAATRRGGAVGVAAVALVAAVSVALVVETARTDAAQRPHWGPVAAALAARPAARRAILIRGTGTWAVPLAHYLTRTWWAGSRGVRASEIDVLRRLPGPRSCWSSGWWGATCEMLPRARLRRPPARGFRLVSERRVAGFAIDRYRAPRPVLIYQRRPPLDVPPGAAQRGERKLLFTPSVRPAVP